MGIVLAKLNGFLDPGREADDRRDLALPRFLAPRLGPRTREHEVLDALTFVFGR
ncbi:hypothetical protein ACVOMT_16585 [Sphingomonas panni]